MPSLVIVIVGATSMIGRACYDLFSEMDHQLVLVSPSMEKLKSMTEKKKAKHAPKLFALDISDEEAVRDMIEDTDKAFGRIDAMIYNAAIYPWKKIEELSYSDWQNTLNTNLSGAFLTTKECIPLMKKQKKGHLIFLSSIAGEQMGLPYMSVYSSTKAALNGFMRTAAIELAEYNINANCISPGKIYDTDTLTEDEIKEKTRAIPLKRFQKPKDIASLILFLLSDNAKNMTGQNYIIDGGQTIVGEDSHIN